MKGTTRPGSQPDILGHTGNPDYLAEQLQAFESMSHVQRARWLGDRLTDAVEAVNLRGAFECPPGLIRQINQWRQLLGLRPKRISSPAQAHSILMDTMGLLANPLKDDLTDPEGHWYGESTIED